MAREIVEQIAEHVEHHGHHVGRHYPTGTSHSLHVAGMTTKQIEQCSGMYEEALFSLQKEQL